MELLVIPVLLSVGALLVFLGVGDTPAFETIPGATYFRRPQQQQRPTVNSMRAYTPPPASIIEPAEVTFSDTDALLSDVLSEMMEIREELKALQTRLESLEKREEPAATPRARRPRVEY